LSLGAVAVSAKASLTESNGKLLNYMECGLPVVATDTPVNHELLGGDGVFVPVGDVDALAASIVALLRDPARRRATGAALRRRAETLFAWPALIDRLIAVYGDIVAPAA
jgi:glycosyltransferase involved in cell wall biosynthesis